MPYGDGTGPWWAQGKWRCRRPGVARGYEVGYGPGYGRGFSQRMVQQYTEQPQNRDSDVAELEAYATSLEIEFNEVKRKLKELRR